MFGLSGKYLLGFLWTLPTSLLGWIFFGIAYLFGVFEKVQATKELIFIWDLKENSKFCKKLFSGRGWAGFSIGNNVILLEYSDSDRHLRTFKHEREHCLQQYCWGILFFPVYLLSSVYVYLMYPDLHSYYDNPFEVQARRSAGQNVKIPKENWADGSNDRWIWW